VTREAIAAREQDKDRADNYVDEVLKRMWGFRVPVFGKQRRAEARQAMLNFYRNPGTRLYDTMTTRTDSYRVACFEKRAS
jgi:hypothetical protein